MKLHRVTSRPYKFQSQTVREGDFTFERRWLEVDGRRLMAHRFEEPTKSLFWHRHEQALIVAVLDPGYRVYFARGPTDVQTRAHAPSTAVRFSDDPLAYPMYRRDDWHAVEIVKPPVRTFAVFYPFDEDPQLPACLDRPRSELRDWHDEIFGLTSIQSAR